MAAGTMTQSDAEILTSTDGQSNLTRIIYACTGNSSDGTFPNDSTQATNAANAAMIKGKQLVEVRAYPSPGGTAPDAADITIIDEYGADLLGGKGVGLISATVKQTCTPYNAFTSSWYFPIITGALTPKIANQAKASANITIELIFAASISN